MIPVLADSEDMPPIQTGPEWFAQQPADVQRQILGNGAYEAYRRGEIQLQDMATRTESERWGGSVRRSTLTEARANARRR